MLNLNFLKELEILIRSNEQFSKFIFETLSSLSEWDLKIANDFILRVKRSVSLNRIEFLYKQYEKFCNKPNLTFFQESNFDLLICLLRRDQYDYYLTDAKNRLVIPDDLNRHDFFDIWGYDVTTARNICIEYALKHHIKYVLFIDDDVLAPNNALLRLWNTHNEFTYEDGTKPICSSALYYKKIEPLSPPFESSNGAVPTDGGVYIADKIIGMGFALLDLEEITKTTPLPLFWNFIDNNGIWLMGEDAFFTQNLVNYTNKPPIVDTSIKCLHFDKNYKQLYGEREENTIYASHIWELNSDAFFNNRKPPNYPYLQISIPTREEKDPIAVSLPKLQIYRTYETGLFRIWNQPVDSARNMCALEALKKDAEFLLFIDDDIIPPEDGLVKLMDSFTHIKTNLDNKIVAITGDYIMKGDAYLSVHLNIESTGKVKELNKIINPNLIENRYIKSNWMIGLGFCLIHTDIFKQSRFPYFQCYEVSNGSPVNEDAHFTELTFRNGYNIYLDTQVQCLHKDFKTNKIYGNPIPGLKYAI